MPACDSDLAREFASDLASLFAGETRREVFAILRSFSLVSLGSAPEYPSNGRVPEIVAMYLEWSEIPCANFQCLSVAFDARDRVDRVHIEAIPTCL
jgi:hypothetical protein